MKKFTIILFGATLLSGNVFAQDGGCDESYSVNLLEKISHEASNACQRQYESLISKINHNSKIAQNRLSIKEDIINENISLLNQAKPYRIIKKAAFFGLISVPVIITTTASAGAALGMSPYFGLLFLAEDGVSSHNFDSKMNKKLSAFKSSKNMSGNILAKKIEQDIKSFETTQNSLLDKKENLQKQVSDNDLTGQNSVEYLMIEIEAAKAQKQVYEQELEYYKNALILLNKSCN